MLLSLKLGPWYWTLIGANILQMILGTATLIKVIRGSKLVFAVFISICIIENATFQIAQTILQNAYVPCY